MGVRDDLALRRFDKLRSYSIAVFSTLTATWLRLELEPLLESRVPFGLFFISSLLTAWLAGTGPAILAAVLSIVSAAHFIIPPHDTLLLNHPSDYMSLVIYLVVTLAAISIFHQRSVQQHLAERSSSENCRLNDELREADRRKDEFLALLAHELRNPLTPIQTAMDLIESGPDERTHAQAIVTIRRQLAQLVRLVNDLLDASRYVHGKLQIRSEPFNLLDAVDIAIETHKSILLERKHQFHVSIPNNPVTVIGDETRMAQAIGNLLHNAAKFTHREGHIRLSVDVSDSLATICVHDDGIGIPNERKRQIFQLFTQVNSNRSRREGGLGIGLALVKELAHLHGGSIRIESDGPGRGSCFTLDVPCLPGEFLATSASISTSDSHLSTETVQTESGLRILLIDDNVDSTQMLQALFEIEGYQIRTAHNGIDGITLAREFCPHLILLDIGLPGMDGYEVARILRRSDCEHKIKIIAVSGWEGEEYRRLSQAAGIDAHVGKPFVPNELLMLIEQYLSSDTESDRQHVGER